MRQQKELQVVKHEKARRYFYGRDRRRYKVLDENHRFTFVCDKCGRCCRGWGIELSPYDILKICDYFGISTCEFLKEFAELQVGRYSEIPYVQLKTQPVCPFNQNGQCNIYEVRPFLCRAYPVGRYITLDETTSKVEKGYNLARNCSTIQSGKSQTIGEWLMQQCGENYLEKSLRWSEFLLRLSESDYPKGEDSFAQLFVFFVYDVDRTVEIYKSAGVSGSSSPEEKFDAMIALASQENWVDFVNFAQAEGALDT